MTTHPEPAGPLPEPPSRVLVRLMAAASLLRIGETDAGLRALRSVVAVWPEHPLPRYRLAVVLAGAGRGPEALDALAGAVAAGLTAPDDLEAEPAFARLRGDPRYVAALSGTRRNHDALAAGPAAGRSAGPGATRGSGGGPGP